MLDYMEQHMSKRLNPSSVLGPAKSKKSSYLKSIMPSKVFLAEQQRLKQQYEKPAPRKHPNDALKAKLAAQSQARRDKMVLNYRDRLLPRFNVV